MASAMPGAGSTSEKLPDFRLSRSIRTKGVPESAIARTLSESDGRAENHCINMLIQKPLHALPLDLLAPAIVEGEGPCSTHPPTSGTGSGGDVARFSSSGTENAEAFLDGKPISGS